jgi:hypothetical protein
MERGGEQMKCELTIEIRDLHACPADRPPKTLEVPQDVFSSVDVTTTEDEIDDEAAMKTEKARTEKKERIKIQPLIAFREDLTYRLGGPHGKLMGLFREVAASFWSQKVEGFKVGYHPFLKSLIIKPQWIPLEKIGEVTIHKIPQIMAGRKKVMILQYYEQMDCKANVTIEMPDGNKEKFIQLLKQAEGMPFGPKRRGELKILQQKWT